MSWWRPPRRAKLDARNVQDLRLYSTDDLRHLYHETKESLIPLRDGIITREEIKAVILRRMWWDRFLLAVTLIGAVAAVIAAIEGWPR